MQRNETVNHRRDRRRRTVVINRKVTDTSSVILEDIYTVATLPAAGGIGRRGFVSDANATTFASVVAGGGANKVPVYDDGTNWRIG